MISDEKRCEVAQELRELRHTTYYREEVVENICDVISIADPVNTFREPEDVYKRLADLINRPTCKNLSPKPADVLLCSECGEHVDIAYVESCDDYRAKYCPNCGSRVVEKGAER